MLPTTTQINSAGRVRTTPGWRLHQNWGHRFNDLDLWFIWAGTGWLKTQGQTHAIRPGFCLLARGGNTYEAGHEDSQSLGVSFIHFDLLTPDGLRFTDFQSPLLPPQVFHVQDIPYVDAVTRRIVQLANDKPTRPLASALLAPVFQDLTRQAFAWAKNPPSHINPLSRHIAHWATRIQEDPSRVPPVAQMAAQSHCSPDHFSRVFKEQTGHTPQHALIQAKITRAHQLLLETNLKIRQIALSLGYCDEFFFTRQFKQQTGKTPRQVRVGLGSNV
jgi:AraC family transcriptional regulator, arabinose operon regulatory protein